MDVLGAGVVGEKDEGCGEVGYVECCDRSVSVRLPGLDERILTVVAVIQHGAVPVIDAFKSPEEVEMEVEFGRVVILAADPSEVSMEVFVHVVVEGLRCLDLVVYRSMEGEGLVQDFDGLG